jgi:hypothetical protein
MEILRTKELAVLDSRLEAFKAVAILGPRQCGREVPCRRSKKVLWQGREEGLTAACPW